MERSLLLLVLIYTNLIGADFIFSAHISTINHVVTYQKISISPSMSSMISKKEEGSYICTLKRKKDKFQQDYEYILNIKDKLFDCFLTQKVKVYENSLFSTTKIDATTQIFITPIYFRAIFTKDNCKIYLIDYP